MDLLRSLPLGLYLEQPITWLHHLDPRVKLAWLMTFLLSPVLASPFWRLMLVGLLILLTLVAAIPPRVWQQQLGWLVFVSILILALTSIMPDGLPTNHQPRLPKDELSFTQQPLPNPKANQRRAWYDPSSLWQNSDKSKPASNGQVMSSGQAAPTNGQVMSSGQAAPTDGQVMSSGQATPTNLPRQPRQPALPQPTPYRYTLFEQGPVTITRRSLELGIRASTLLFTLIYSTNLYLLTTAPEEITAGLESLMQPLRRFRWPITEILLTLTLSLRFIPLVLEEVQNLFRSIRTRAINWKKLGVRRAIQVWLMLADRLLENLFLRAEQIASAMKVRGFTSPNQHQVRWSQLSLKAGDWVALGCLAVFWGARVWLGRNA